MAEFFPLSDLRDPVAFLMGARVPLVVPTAPAARHEWCCDHYYQRNSHGYPFAFQTDGLVWSEVALDLAHPDVARWVDRKIGEHLCGCPCYVAGFRIVDGQWDMTLWNPLPKRDWTTRAACLSGIPCDLAHVPTARGALLRALYGKEAT